MEMALLKLGIFYLQQNHNESAVSKGLDGRPGQQYDSKAASGGTVYNLAVFATNTQGHQLIIHKSLESESDWRVM
jgi:hypothetical protein